MFFVCFYISASEKLNSVATAGISAGVVVGTVFFGTLLAFPILGVCLCLRMRNDGNSNLALSVVSICLCPCRENDGNNSSKNGQVTHCWLIAVDPV